MGVLIQAWSRRAPLHDVVESLESRRIGEWSIFRSRSVKPLRGLVEKSSFGAARGGGFGLVAVVDGSLLVCGSRLVWDRSLDESVGGRVGLFWVVARCLDWGLWMNLSLGMVLSDG